MCQCLFVFGCSNDPRPPISGSVTFDGVPIQDGSIVFLPEDGTRASGSAPIINGKFTANVSSGRMDVQICDNCEPTAEKPAPRRNSPMGGSGMPGSGPQKIQFVPAKFNAASTILADIQETQKDLNFDLKYEE